ncbi:MAG: 3-hydroxyacyl-CoA dehydrogenase family protein [Candidatus Eisenbacteria bacterium]|nr:3-hydroxyacyl-CoA dehydrogenase family protein [Candidatus Eisenbacteria bacterium]
MEIKKVGVVGCGLMGSGITQVSAQSGYETWVKEVDDDRLKEGIGKIEKLLSTEVERGRLTENQMTEMLDRINGTMKLEDLRACDIVIETVAEEIALKKQIFSELDKVIGRAAILASNTSSISIAELASVTKRPDKVIGLRFFDPVPVTKLVEVVRTPTASDEVISTGVSFAESLGKQPVVVKDSSGFAEGGN